MKLGRRQATREADRVRLLMDGDVLEDSLVPEPGSSAGLPDQVGGVAGEAAEGNLVVGHQQGVEVADRAVGTVEAPGRPSRPPGGAHEVGLGDPGPVALHEKGPVHLATVAPPPRWRIGGGPYVCPTSTLCSPSSRRAPSSTRERIPSFR